MMFVGENGVQVSAFYGGTPSAAGPYLTPAGPADSRTPRRLAAAGEPFQGLQAARSLLAAMRESGSLHRVDTACKAGKKSIMPIEFACDLTEFALLGTATLRRYSTPAAGDAPRIRLGRVRPVGLRGGVDSGVRRRPCACPRGAPPGGHPHRRAVLPKFQGPPLGRRRPMRFTNDEQANGYRGHALPQGVGLQGLAATTAPRAMGPCPCCLLGLGSD